MHTSANPGLELTDPQAYRAKTLARLHGRDPLDILSETPGALRAMIAGIPPATLRRRPFADRWTWTPLEVIGHLLDDEWTYGWRIRTVLCDDHPTIMGMDQERWVARQRHNEVADASELLDDFAALRAINLRLWRRVTPEEMKRSGDHAERGEESLQLMLHMHAGHDLGHIEQIRKYLEALKA